MRRSHKPIVIASRRSRLARAQAEMVGRALTKLHPAINIGYRWIDSEGDRHEGVMLADQGGKGLFTGAIEQALLRREADLAVHSLKDLPAEETPGLTIAATPRRGDVRDCLISRERGASVDDLPQGAVVGTASPRRESQLLSRRPDLHVELLRGNVETRLRRVLGASEANDQDAQPGEPPLSQTRGRPIGTLPTESEQHRYDATLLSVAGLRRLGLKHHARVPIAADELLPAACQGALAIQCRADDHVALTRCLPLNDPITATAVHTEREVVKGLGADCRSPLAVLAQRGEAAASGASPGGGAQRFRLRVRVLSTDGGQRLDVDEVARPGDLPRLVRDTLEDLTRRGALRMLHQAE